MTGAVSNAGPPVAVAADPAGGDERAWRRWDRRREVLRQGPRRGQAADREPVVLLDLGGHARPAELGRAQDPGRRHLGRGVGLVQEPGDRARDRLGLARRDEQRLAVAPDDALVAVDVATRRSAPRRPSPRAARSRTTRGRSPGTRTRRAVRNSCAFSSSRDPPQELHAVEPAGRDVAAGLALLRPAPDEEQAALAAGLAQDPVRLQEVEDALAGLEPPDEQDVRGAVLPAGHRHGPAEPLDVDAVGDDLVVAGEVAVDEVARGRRHRDPAVEPVRVGAHRAAAELVGRRPAAVGVERGDVHALRLAQHDRARGTARTARGSGGRRTAPGPAPPAPARCSGATASPSRRTRWPASRTPCRGG